MAAESQQDTPPTGGPSGDLRACSLQPHHGAPPESYSGLYHAGMLSNVLGHAPGHMRGHS